ncbi:family 43 glycosylhydrolase [Butyrivibrio sp. YAB3001]|uniref:family 43 glycosylhydrolase n=1 Tax=Butyrivibrio sp. YAB3001 TaxID=1520812 RepID=UPI0008F68790|nr:family 43 glycosylhydrolase [Butyrivibrio sp. YAB3001]SFC47503.1 xylan 1,4-beta-xylosidase [Butyrivibrio sp. YAB3001]
MDLSKAIAESNLDEVKSILINDPNLVSKESLFDAAKKGSLELVKYLVEYSRISLNEYDSSHRNVLHYAAESGNIELFRYLIERCGMDPFEGDHDLVTSWDIVHKSEGKEIENYLEKRYGHKYDEYYKNPVRSGFFPDPSICRVGDDYYMVNSSFIFFPCIPISHSKDLIHWEIIGHAITTPDWAYLDELEGGRGYWAPDISFYEGKFYITATYRLNDVPPVYRRQVVLYSENPEGPYSKPVFIDEDGIDPSIFNDDDGKRYMLLNRGARIFELNKYGTRKISEAQLLFYGDHKRAPEGPHLYKKDGYYYLLEAEGGTGLGHRVTVSRSKELFGNYEPCPYNPIMRQDNPDAAIQRCGHGDLVETQDGRWYMVYLCGRTIGDGYSILGRETALDPVTWTADGWPIVNNLKGPSAMQIKPFKDAPFDDQFKISECGLPFDYMTPRPFKKGDVLYNKETGIFSIRGSRAPLSSLESRNLVLRRQTSFSFIYEVTLVIPKMSDGQNAGITGYYDENTYLEFGITSRDGNLYLYANEHIGDEDRFELAKEAIASDIKTIRLKMTTNYLERKLLYQFDGADCEKEFKNLSNVFYLCDEGLSKGKRFTGALVGMYAYAGNDDLVVDFSQEQYSHGL